jgi:hypothetical protein
MKNNSHKNSIGLLWLSGGTGFDIGGLPVARFRSAVDMRWLYDQTLPLKGESLPF